MSRDKPNRLTSVTEYAIGPTHVTILLMLMYLGSVLASSDWDPMAFVRIGAQYQQEGAVDEQGYDGQFVYFIARNPDPDQISPFLDDPAYRYQRILLPMLARLLSFGRLEALPWMLLLIGFVSHAAGTWFVEKTLVRQGVSRWYALTYGLWVGFLLAVRLDLPEPLAYGLVAAGIYLGKKRPAIKWIAFGLALFAKEVTILFLAGQMLADLLNRRWRELAGMVVFALVPIGLFQIWLLDHFDSPGFIAGGYTATGFEVIPFMGWLRAAEFSWLFTVVYGFIVVPFFYFPAIWGLVRSVRKWLDGQQEAIAAMLAINAVIIPFLPFSTVREPGGLFRFGCGLVLASLLFFAEVKHRRALNYSFLWLVLNAILLNR